MASSSALQQLPREMRYQIYQLVALSQPIGVNSSLQRQPDRLFLSKAAILLVSKQIHNEYLQTVQEVALAPNFPNAVIEIPVTELNFSNVIAFAKTLTPLERTTVGPKLLVNLRFISSDLREASRRRFWTFVGGLKAWLDFCCGTGFTVQYASDRHSVCRVYSEVWDELPFCLGMGTFDDGPAAKEMGKMRKAVYG